ncbi:MAG: hypothetical protein ACXVJD_05310 [Mucilaginibacter sp.]
MRSKVYKLMLLVLTAFFAVCTTGAAQNVSVSVGHPVISVNTGFNDKDLQVKMDNISRNIENGLSTIGKNISATINNIASNIKVEVNSSDEEDAVTTEPKINLNLGSLLEDADINLSDGSDYDENPNSSLKVKSYSKSYPLDANDRIKLSNQFGKITVNTWNRREIKVDVQIKAEAMNDDDAQKLIDGVQINDSKNGDQVSFRTNIERNNEGSWNIFKWGGKNKKQKLTINYTVYMPAKNELNVETSYGSIELPEMDGKVRLDISYGSASVQSLSSSFNEIESSYASLKVGSMNGGRLDFSYGSVNIDECNNLKADMSYGSFKLGKLRGAADMDLSYVSGFKIDELTSSFKKLNIDASYSTTSVGVGTANFDFDVSTSYSGFGYNENKVIVTSKTPPDGSKHIGSNRNYKGHVGRGATDAQVNVHTSYGGVNFE